jgi:hypothetical protein
MNWRQVDPVINHKVRGLCTKPYTGHPKGCPNFNTATHPWCPPTAPLFDEIVDMNRPIWAIWNVFDLATHVRKMRLANPRWTDRQLRNCLYWQPSARKELREEIDLFQCAVDRGICITHCPEAMGVDVTETMKRAGLYLQWPPEDNVYQVALAYYLKPEYEIRSEAMQRTFGI